MGRDGDPSSVGGPIPPRGESPKHPLIEDVRRPETIALRPIVTHATTVGAARHRAQMAAVRTSCRGASPRYPSWPLCLRAPKRVRDSPGDGPVHLTISLLRLHRPVEIASGIRTRIGLRPHPNRRNRYQPWSVSDCPLTAGWFTHRRKSPG
jgi:hypothetical protein